MAMNWDDAYSNMDHIPGSGALPGIWSEQSALYRASGARCDLDLPYGSAERERFDLFYPDGTSKGLAVFIHGGYWMRTDKSFWSELAEGARASGWTVCMPSYTLTPAISISGITQQIGAAIATAAARVAGPICLAGHSAGGHLVSRMVCSDTPLSPDLRARLRNVVSLSGLHDLRPLRHTQMNETLGLSLEEARAESAALCEPLAGVPIRAWVGGGERPEFIRQARLLDMIWKGFDVEVQLTVEGAFNHFTVLDALKDPGSDLTQAWIGP